MWRTHLLVSFAVRGRLRSVASQNPGCVLSAVTHNFSPLSPLREVVLVYDVDRSTRVSSYLAYNYALLIQYGTVCHWDMSTEPRIY